MQDDDGLPSAYNFADVPATFDCEEKVVISRDRYADLLDSEFKLQCLENGGVDNWTWYSESLKEGGYYDDEDDV